MAAGGGVIDAVAREYVHLVLAVGKHDADYVDAYYGPPAWRAEAKTIPLAEIRKRARQAVLESEGRDEEAIEALRRGALRKGLQALIARVEMLDGVRMPFDTESEALYGVVDPGRPDQFYDAVIADLEGLLPGEGSLGERFETLRKRFYVPADRLEAVFGAAIEAARGRTKRRIGLPEGENFRVEYVRDKVWGAYNWYEGDARSLIQVNTDSPTAVDGAIHLACHEGYPGHHVYNALLEKELAQRRGWIEFTVYPLYGPQSLIAEGTAEYGVELVFPEAERRAFERETLFPLAGLDAGPLDEYAEARKLMGKLGYASNDAARRYLDGDATREETLEWLRHYTLATPERAERRLRFIEHNRSYVVTYNLGEDLVREYVESRATTEDGRWRVFTHLLSTPQTPSDLKAHPASGAIRPSSQDPS